jgi:hypothetical protein
MNINEKAIDQMSPERLIPFNKMAKENTTWFACIKRQIRFAFFGNINIVKGYNERHECFFNFMENAG